MQPQRRRGAETDAEKRMEVELRTDEDSIEFHFSFL